MLEVAIDKLGVPAPTQVSFTKDVFPSCCATHRYRWVNQVTDWASLSQDWLALANPSPASAGLPSIGSEIRTRTLRTRAFSIASSSPNNNILYWINGGGQFQSDWQEFHQLRTR